MNAFARILSVLLAMALPTDLLPVDAPVLRLVCVRNGWRYGDEAEPVYGRSDHRDFEGA